MPAETLSTELIHHILRHLGASLHAEEKKVLLHCALASHVFLAISREVLLSNLTIDLDCNSQDAESYIPEFFDLFMNPWHSFTRPLSLNIVCWPSLRATSRPHWEEARQSLLEGFERYKSLVKVDSIRVEMGPPLLPDRPRVIPALSAFASPCIRRLDVLDTWGDTDLRAWMDAVSHGKCPNLQDIQLRFYGWVPVSDFTGASSSMLTVLNLAGGMSRLWISFLNWVERGGAVLESLSLGWTLNDGYEDDISSRLRNVFSHRVTSQLKKIYFDGPSVPVDLAHLSSLRFVSINVNRYQGREHLCIAPGTSRMLSTLKQYRIPLTIEVNIAMPYKRMPADAVSLDDFLVEFFQERRNLTDKPLTIEFRDVSHLESTDAEELANLSVPNLRRLTKLTKGEMRRWSMQSVPC